MFLLLWAGKGAAQDYEFARPDTVISLPGSLKEISGLTALDARRLGAITDEKGVLYIIHLPGCQIEERPFGKKGDYEGIERVADQLWVLRSDGTLIQLLGWEGKITARTYNTKLSGKNDTEGLAYDQSLRRLLILAKESPAKGVTKARSVFAFDPGRYKMDEEVAFNISEESLGGGKLDAFKPSGIAIHPVTRERYILSSVSRTVTVVDPDGNVQAIYPLPPVFEQPEGIAFTPNGDLYISSEGVKKPAVLARYRNPAR